MECMGTLKAVVHNGRLTLDEPTDLPEGTVVGLVPEDPYAHLDDKDAFADMPDEERERLHAALDQSEKEFEAGEGIPAEQALRELRESR